MTDGPTSDILLLGDGGDLLGDGSDLLGEGGDLIGDNGDLLGDGGDLLGNGGKINLQSFMRHASWVHLAKNTLWKEHYTCFVCLFV